MLRYCYNPYSFLQCFKRIHLLKEPTSAKRAGSAIKSSAPKKNRTSLSSSFENTPSSLSSNHITARKNYEVILQRPAPTDLVRPVSWQTEQTCHNLLDSTMMANVLLLLLQQDTPPLDLESISDTLKEKEISPSTLKFGFLGLGIMGSGIVKNLINSGHSVIVWNRTPSKVGFSNFYPLRLFYNAVLQKFQNKIYVAEALHSVLHMR